MGESMKMNRIVPILVIVAIIGIQAMAGVSSAVSYGYHPDHHYNFSMLKPGDIIFCYNPWMAWLPGYWTHVAIFVGYDSHGQGWIIESTTGWNGGPAGVHYSKLQELYKYPVIAIGRVKASQWVIHHAIAWIKTKVGDPYDYHIWKKEVDNGKFYCSELVWAGYYVYGVNLDRHPGFSWKYLWGVAPQEIYDSHHVEIISIQWA